jgi:sugar lactone lactonase YvrE
VATARGSVWVAAPHAVVRIDPSGSRPAVRLPSTAGLVGLAAEGRVIWAMAADGALTRLDPQRAIRSGAIPATLPNSRPVAIAAAPKSVFVADRQGRLLRLDGLGRHPRWIGIGKSPVAVTAGDGFAWVALPDGTVLQVRPRVGEWQVRRIVTGGTPAAIAFGGGRAWVARTDGRLLSIAARSGHRALVAQVGAGARDVAYSEGSVWVARGSGRNGKLIEVSP